jgi:hypothetical protein
MPNVLISPMCVRMCAVRLPDVEKALPHVSHRCGFPPSDLHPLAVGVPSLFGEAGLEVWTVACHSLTGGAGDVLLLIGQTGRLH